MGPIDRELEEFSQQVEWLLHQESGVPLTDVGEITASYEDILIKGLNSNKEPRDVAGEMLRALRKL